MYNTYFVHVVMLDKFVDKIDYEADLINNLFLPKYKNTFYPWGPVLQQCWALLLSFHLTLRIIVFVQLIER